MPKSKEKLIFRFDSGKTENPNWFIAIGAFSAALAIVLGALSMHALKAFLQESDPTGLFGIALQYHQYHSLGLIVVGIVAKSYSSKCITWSGILMTLGIVLFSGSLYLRSLSNIHSLHVVTPFGGAALIFSWALLGFGVARRNKV